MKHVYIAFAFCTILFFLKDENGINHNLCEKSITLQQYIYHVKMAY